MASDQRVVVVGLGYVGLPLVVEAVSRGLSVVGLDTSSHVVEQLNEGRSHVDDIDDVQVGRARSAGFVATTDPTCIADADVIVICVPTPLDESRAPDLSAVLAASKAIAMHLKPGLLIVLESTTYPGTTDGPVREILESTGLVAGVDFNLAFSPERIDPGNPTWTLRNTPKVVGGYTPACTDRAATFYGSVVETVVRTSGCREAEMAKLLENTYRHINIALVNEMAIFSRDLGVDLWAAIDAARTKPFGFAAFYPGPGVGGHCIPIDPNYLSHKVRSLGYQFRFVELAQEISGRMPAYVATRVQNLLNEHGKPMKGARVLLLGLTYKPNISDDRETPARELVRRLWGLGCVVTANDPHLTEFAVDGQLLDLADDVMTVVNSCDVVVLLQAHAAYDLARIAAEAPLVFDTRGVMRGPNVERL